MLNFIILFLIQGSSSGLHWSMEDGGGNAGTEAYLMGAGTATAARSSRFESGGLINVRFEEV